MKSSTSIHLIVFFIIFFCCSFIQAQILEVDGSIKISNSPILSPPPGTIRWNSTNEDFEGFNGSIWISLTKNGWGMPIVSSYENTSISASNGEMDDQFGLCVSIDGDYAAAGTAAGNQAYAYIRTGTSWSEQAKLTPSTGVYNFGNSIAISDDYVIVGSSDGLLASPYPMMGAAFIFHRTDTTWTEQTILTPSDGFSEDHFGNSVAISGDYVIVGAYNHDTDGNQDQGKAYIFHRTDTTWTEQSKISASNGILLALFGYSVSISGDYALVGAHNQSSGIPYQGSAYVYHRSDTTWSEEEILTASDAITNAEFGNSVSIFGNYAVIGAHKHTINDSTDQGAAYVFKRNGSDWTEQGQLTASHGTQGDQFGSSVSLSGEYIVVGAAYKNADSNADQGRAYIYHFPGESWIEQSILIASDGSMGDNYGNSVGINENVLIIGAKNHDSQAMSNSGKVYFFNR